MSDAHDEHLREELNRQRELDKEMYTQLVQISKEKSVITLSEFRKFEPLYQTRDTPPSRFSEEAKMLAALSNEFIQRINPYKPFDVVDDYDPSKILCTLPATYCEITPITTKERMEHMVQHGNLSTSNLPHDKDKATAHAVLAIIRSQDTEAIKKRRAQFIELDQKFAKIKLGLDDNDSSVSNGDTGESSEINLDFDE